MAVELRRRRFTIAEYERMAETGILDEDDRVELIEGEIVEMSPIGPPHASIVARINAVLVSRFAGRAISRVVASDAVAFDISGLDREDPLRRALFVVLSALGPVTLSTGQLERIGAVARLVGRQA